jgi:hypothetical protein
MQPQQVHGPRPIRPKRRLHWLQESKVQSGTAFGPFRRPLLSGWIKRSETEGRSSAIAAGKREHALPDSQSDQDETRSIPPSLLALIELIALCMSIDQLMRSSPARTVVVPTGCVMSPVAPVARSNSTVRGRGAALQ